MYQEECVGVRCAGEDVWVWGVLVRMYGCEVCW